MEESHLCPNANAVVDKLNFLCVYNALFLLKLFFPI